MKKLLILAALAVATGAARAADENTGHRFMFADEIADYARIVDNGDGTASITIVTTNGTEVTATVYNKATVDTALAGKVPTTRKVNGKALNADVTLYGGDVQLSSTDSTTLKAALESKADAANIPTLQVDGTALGSSDTAELGNGYIKVDGDGHAVLWVRK